MGLADMLIKMKIPYDSEEGLTICDKISKSMIDSAIYSSALLAEKKGVYPMYKSSVVDTPFFIYNTTSRTKEAVEEYGLRNSQILTIAPTGSLSTMLGISGGVEPIFANYYTRKTESLHGEDKYYKVYTPIVDRYMKEQGLEDESQLPAWFVTSKTIDPLKRVEMQSVWQSRIDASISSTVNLPYEATIEDVKNIYMKAWELGLKGITIFRDGCKRVGVLTTETDKSTDTPSDFLKRGDIIECSQDLVGKKRKLITGCGSLHVLAWFDPLTGELMEVFFPKGSTGGCANFTTGLSRTISLLCRAGVDVYTIKDQLDSTGICGSYATRSATKRDTSKGSCCPMAIGNALVEMYEDMQAEIDSDWESKAIESKVKREVVKVDTTKKHLDEGEECPECGEASSMSGGCSSCNHCGWSRCE